MTKVTFHIHPETEAVLASRPAHAGDVVGRALTTVLHAMREHAGRDVTYCPVPFGDGVGCALSARVAEHGLVVEMDAPGTMLPRRGLVVAVRTSHVPTRRWHSR